MSAQLVTRWLMFVSMFAISVSISLDTPRRSESLASISSRNLQTTTLNITFLPSEPLAPRMDGEEVNFAIFVTSPDLTSGFVSILDYSLVKWVPDCMDCDIKEFNISDGAVQIDIQLRGIRIGKTALRVFGNETNKDDMSWRSFEAYHPVVVVPEIPQLLVAGLVIFITGMGINLMGFGSTVRMDMVKEIAENPRALIISFCLQCLFMPMASYVLGLIFSLSVHMRLGLFLCGCCPSGTPSNIYSFLFQGDVARSVIMTVISTVATIVVMPFWILTLGNSILHEGYPARYISVPWAQLVLYLFIFSVPGLLGVLVGCLAPLKVSRLVATLLRPIGLLIVIGGVGIVIAKLYFIFDYVDSWQIVVGPCFLPLIGCLVGFPLTAVATKSNRIGITVGMETLFQNVAMAVMWLGINLPQPEAFLAILMPIMVILSSVCEPLVILPFVIMYRRCKSPCGTNSADISEEGSGEKEREANAAPRERKLSIHYIL